MEAGGRRHLPLAAVVLVVPLLLAGCIGALDGARDDVAVVLDASPGAPGSIVEVVTDPQGDAYEKNADWLRGRPWMPCHMADPATEVACDGFRATAGPERGELGSDGVVPADPAVDILGVSMRDTPEALVVIVDLAGFDEEISGWGDFWTEDELGQVSWAIIEVGWKMAGLPDCWSSIIMNHEAFGPQVSFHTATHRCAGEGQTPPDGWTGWCAVWQCGWDVDATFHPGQPGRVEVHVPRDLLLDGRRGATLEGPYALAWMVESNPLPPWTVNINEGGPRGDALAHSRIPPNARYYADMAEGAGSYTLAHDLGAPPRLPADGPHAVFATRDADDPLVDLLAYDMVETRDTVALELTLANVRTPTEDNLYYGYWMDLNTMDGSYFGAWVDVFDGAWNAFAYVERNFGVQGEWVGMTVPHTLEIEAGSSGKVRVVFDRTDLPRIEAGSRSEWAAAFGMRGTSPLDDVQAGPLFLSANSAALDDPVWEWTGATKPYVFRYDTDPMAYEGITLLSDAAGDSSIPATVAEENVADSLDIITLEARAHDNERLRLTMGIADLSAVTVPLGYEAVYYAFGLQRPGGDPTMVGYYKGADDPAGTFLCAQDTSVLAQAPRDPTQAVWTVIDGLLTTPGANQQGGGGSGGSLAFFVPYECLGVEPGDASALELDRLEAATFLVRNPTGRAGLGELERVDDARLPGAVTIPEYQDQRLLAANAAPAGGLFGGTAWYWWALRIAGGIGGPATFIMAVRARRRDKAAEEHAIYRAAVEQKLVAGKDVEADDEVLVGLRQRFGISDRDHGLIVEHVQAELGRSYVSMAPGATYLNRYEVSRVLGEGGFSRTYLAFDRTLEREVVLKVARWENEKEQKRALKEARTLAKLDHPNVVRVLDVERLGDEVVQVLEYVPNGSLADRLADGPMRPAEALTVVSDTLSALAAAHEAGVLHRDVKPANILLTAAGRAKLCDFGIAREDGSGTVSVMGADAGAGTVLYMSPEQAKGGELDVRSDVYAAAVVLYETLTGRHYLDVEGLAEFEVRLAIVDEAPLIPIEAVPRAVNDVLARALAKDPGHRPPSAAAFQEELSHAALVA